MTDPIDYIFNIAWDEIYVRPKQAKQQQRFLAPQQRTSTQQHTLPSSAHSQSPKAALPSHTGSGPALVWSGFPLPLTQLEGHFLTIGKTGSGKSLLTYPAVASAVRAAGQASDTRVVVFDPKGDMLPIVAAQGVPFRLVNINDTRAWAWNIAQDCQSPDDARQLAANLVPQTHATSDPFWVQGAQNVLAAIIMSLKTMCGDDWGLPDLVNAATMDGSTLTQFLTVAPENQGTVNRIMRASSEKTRDGILMQLGIATDALYLAASHQYHTPRDRWLSLAEFMQESSVLLISMDLTAREASTPIMRAMFRRLVDYANALSDSRTRKTFIFLDECPFLGKLPGLHELLTFGRSKGTHCWITGQAIEQFRALYGEHQASAMEGSCDFKALLKTNSQETARWACGLFGQYRAFEVTPSMQYGGQGVTHSEGMHKVIRDRFITSDFLGLPQPGKREGLTFFLLSPFTEGLRIHLSGSQVHSLQPDRADIPAQSPKPSRLKTFPLWDCNDLRRVLKVTPDDELLETFVHGRPAPAWVKVLRLEIYQTLKRLIEGERSEYFARRYSD
jgi:hypothetical protein